MYPEIKKAQIINTTTLINPNPPAAITLLPVTLDTLPAKLEIPRIPQTIPIITNITKALILLNGYAITSPTISPKPIFSPFMFIKD